MLRAGTNATTFIGDIFDLDTFYFPNWICHSMPTAIFRIYTPYGFVVAADGRACGDSVTNILTDKMCKIFSIESIGRSLAYSLAGTATLASDLSKGSAFSFRDEFRRAAVGINPGLSRNLYGHCTRICRNILAALLLARSSGRIDGYPSQCRRQEDEPGSTIVRIFVDGYFKGQPSRVQVRFWHEDQELRDPDIKAEEIASGLQLLHGSEVIGRLLFATNDERFSQYRCAHTELTLETAANMAVNYIQASGSPAAQGIDADVCGGIGGRIHIATVTPQDGFRWVSGFDPISEKLAQF